MEISFLLRSYLIGMLAASGCGPIFVLTFNRSAVCGFWKGFATAIGASLADAFYFSLGLFGALAVLSEFKYFMIFLDIIGGLLLIALGFHSLKKMKQVVCVTVECSYSAFFSVGKAFTITLLNPLVIIFFMAVTMQVMPEDVIAQLSFPYVLSSGLCVCLGSLTILGSFSLIASYFGSCITARRLQIISGITGVVFIIFGSYLLSDFVVNLIKLFF